METCRAKTGKRWRIRPGSDATSTAKVGLPQILVLEQVGRLAGQDDAPGLQDVAAVGDPERDVRVLLDDQDRDAGLVHLLDDLEVALDQDRREPHRRLAPDPQTRA